MSIFGKMGRQYWQDELQKMMGVTSGETLPQELPEYKGMANMFNSQANNQLANVIKQLSQKGITGGAASGAITGMNENTTSGLLKMIQGIYGNVNARANSVAEKGMDWDKFMLGLWQNEKQMDQQEDQFNKKLWMDLGTRLAGAGAGALAGGAQPPAAPTGTGMAGGLTSTPGGLADWYKKMYGG